MKFEIGQHVLVKTLTTLRVGHILDSLRCNDTVLYEIQFNSCKRWHHQEELRQIPTNLPLIENCP